jgi:hypothetical protein
MTTPLNRFDSDRWTVPARRGPRPTTTHPTREQPAPHQQLSDIAPRELQEELLRRVRTLPEAEVGWSAISVPYARGFHLKPHARQGPGGSVPARLRVRSLAPRTRRQPAPVLAARSLRRCSAGRLGRTTPAQRNHARLRAARRGRVGGGLAAGLRVVQLGDGNERRYDASRALERRQPPARPDQRPIRAVLGCGGGASAAAPCRRDSGIRAHCR